MPVRPLAFAAMMLAAVVSRADDAAVPASSVDALFAAYAQPGSPGVAVGVYRGGRIVFAKGYGLADLESGAPITPRTQFHIASVSKQFAAFAIALLAREGRIDLDADVRRYLPWFPDLGHRITARELVHHTSGLRDQWSLFEMGGRELRDVLRQQQVVELVKRQRSLNFEPGTDFLYSNTGYTLLAELVRAVSGRTLRQFTAERMFAPLGMRRTFFYDDVRELVPGRANSYEREAGGPWMRSLLNYDTVGATSLFTTIEDLAHWAGNFGRPVVGDAALIAEISRSGALTDGTPVRYGFGLSDLPQDGRKAVSHSGSDAAFLSYFVYYPEHDFAIALLANCDVDLVGKVNAIASVYLPPVAPEGVSQGTVSSGAAAPDAATLDALAGVYVQPHQSALVLERRDGRLLAREGGYPRVSELVFSADGRFRFREFARGAYRPVRAPDGRISGLQFEPLSGLPARTLKRVERVTSGAGQLARLTGDFYSAELDITYTFSVEGGQLVARNLRFAEPIRFIQVSADQFDSLSFTLDSVTFERDRSGRAVAVELNANRAYGLEARRVVAP